MKVVMLYRPKSDHSRKVEDFVRDFIRFNPDRAIEMVSVDSREGTEKASLYGIVQYPAVIALSDEGSMLRCWQGGQLPLMDEVAYYAH